MSTLERFVWRPGDVEWDEPGGAKDFNPALHPRDRQGRFSEVEGRSGVLAVPSRLEDLPEPAREVWSIQMAHYGVTVAALRETIASKIDQDAVDHASDWYPAVNQMCVDTSKETGISPERIAAAFSACSPKCHWEDPDGEGEVRYIPSMARFVADGKADGLSPLAAMEKWKAEYKATNTTLTQKGEPKGASLMNTSGSRGMAVLMGVKTPDDVLNDNKTRSFFDNIVDPGNTHEVTIDTHMAKVLENTYGVDHDSALAFIKETGGTVATDSRVLGVGYLAISEAVREVASRYDVSPDIVQAAYWEQVQNEKVISYKDGKDWPTGVPKTKPKPKKPKQ